MTRCLPLFKKAENNECFGANDYRGIGGPLNVSYLRSPSVINEAFLQACESQGLPRNPDYNGARQFGAAPAQVTQKERRTLECGQRLHHAPPRTGQPEGHHPRPCQPCRP